ncbi:unnamed protein product [Eruca vesicaria subsp. sativa]|uniref:Uncharacterized protein n=1 Tax=Eruca vesicaria subsp. sativa TaxID=29727 RepID=A0ABC8JVX1_ERUVS|nr:unnamed protein product [Eruca vesicaria subsp. sativa]
MSSEWEAQLKLSSFQKEVHQEDWQQLLQQYNTWCLMVVLQVWTNGLWPYASSLDVIGFFDSTFSDAGMLLHALFGFDRVESTSSKQSQFLSINSFESKPV